MYINCSVYHTFTAPYVFDTVREGHIDISELVYFDSYNGVNRSLISRLYKQEDQCQEVGQDCYQDFSFCYCSKSYSHLKYVLLSEHPAWLNKEPDFTKKEHPCLQVLLW